MCFGVLRVVEPTRTLRSALMSIARRDLPIVSHALAADSVIIEGPSAAQAVELVKTYHHRTKHHVHHFAASPGYMDWATQPDPFRRYAGAELVKLPWPEEGASPAYAQIHATAGVAPALLSLGSVSRFFGYSLALTAWKQSGGAKWALRANPSSGNLHPTEGYALLSAMDGLDDRSALYHYAPKEHALERRAILRRDAWRDLLAAWPERSFLVGLTSIHWREAWKYGERAFRYCQHDIGHAMAALRVAAATLGWKLFCLDGVASDRIETMLGLNRDADFSGVEREEPELLALVVTAEASVNSPTWQSDSLVDLTETWFGRANPISLKHAFEWPVIEGVAAATRTMHAGSIVEDFTHFPSAELGVAAESTVGRVSSAAIILGRRSATAMDGKTPIPKSTFVRMLARLMPTGDASNMPWDAVPWRPRIHLGLFVHRVVGLTSGLYALVRDPNKFEQLKLAMDQSFRWQRVTDCPNAVALYLLREGDCRQEATAISCGQDIAGDGAFCVSMLAEFDASLKEHGARFYRSLFWEAGMVGHMLYLEAEAAGMRGTGIGCYFDDLVHALFGLESSEWQSLYHFTVGGPLDDPRLTTLPAYPNMSVTGSQR